MDLHLPAGGHPAAAECSSKVCCRQLSLFLAALFSVLGGVSCSMTVYDEEAAAERALTFARTAFIEQNIAAAYELLHDETKRNLDLERFKSYLTMMHPDGWPHTVSKKGYEIAPGRNVINIYVNGRSNSETFHYRLEMHEVDGSYSVWGLFRGQGEYPKDGLYNEFKAE